MGDPVTPKALIRSDACGLLELACAYDDSPFRDRLRLGDGWTRRWRGTWLVGEGKVAWPVRDMAGVPVLSSRPVRGFTWRARQGHRPGLQFMVPTGRHHGFESLEEQRLLLVLDSCETCARTGSSSKPTLNGLSTTSFRSRSGEAAYSGRQTTPRGPRALTGRVSRSPGPHPPIKAEKH